MSRQMSRAVGVLVVLLAVAGGVAGSAMCRSVYREFQSYGRLLELVSIGIGLFGLCLLFPGRSVCIWIWLVGGILTAVVFLGPVYLSSIHSPGYGHVCKENLSQIGKAIWAYRQNNEGYMPYDERGPLYSLAILYPDYFLSARPFQCPYVRSSWAKRHMGAQFPADSALSGERCHYGYTWRCAANPSPRFIIAADMPENHAEGGKTGYNVLYADGAITWEEAPFCSHDPNDNIFAREPGWSPDTDSFIRLE